MEDIDLWCSFIEEYIFDGLFIDSYELEVLGGVYIINFRYWCYD